LKKSEVNPQPDLLAGQWTMTKWKDVDDLKISFPIGVPIFKIDAEQGTVSGFNGCNQLNGKLRHTRETATLQFYSIVSTRMFCNTVPEMELTNAITRINKYTVTNEKLVFLVNDEVFMTFERSNGID